MKFELEHDRRNITNEDILNDILNTLKVLNKETITRSDYRKFGKYGTTTINRRFGSWGNILNKLNLNTTRYQKNKKILDIELFENIEKLWRHYGRQPRWSEIKPPISSYSAMPYKNRFGSLRKALEAFVDFINTNLTKTVNDRNIETIKLKKNISRNINLRLRFKVMSRDKFKCVKCGRSPATHNNVFLHIDHRTPYSKDGEPIMENLQTLCSDCNLGKSDEIFN